MATSLNRISGRVNSQTQARARNWFSKIYQIPRALLAAVMRQFYILKLTVDLSWTRVSVLECTTAVVVGSSSTLATSIRICVQLCVQLCTHGIPAGDGWTHGHGHSSHGHGWTFEPGV